MSRSQRAPRSARLSGRMAQQGRGQGKKLGLTSGPGSGAPWYPVIHGRATTLEEDAPLYPAVHGCATTPEEDRSQSHITCSLGPACCSC